MQAKIEVVERRIQDVALVLKKGLDEVSELAETIKAVAEQERKRNEEHDPEERSWLEQGVFAEDLYTEYPTLFHSASNIRYHAKHRKTNGLDAARAVRKMANGRLQFHRKRCVKWALGQ